MVPCRFTLQPLIPIPWQPKKQGTEEENPKGRKVQSTLDLCLVPCLFLFRSYSLLLHLLATVNLNLNTRLFFCACLTCSPPPTNQPTHPLRCLSTHTSSHIQHTPPARNRIPQLRAQTRRNGLPTLWTNNAGIVQDKETRGEGSDNLFEPDRAFQSSTLPTDLRLPLRTSPSKVR